MKPAMMCEYCFFIAQEKTVLEHEKFCSYNPEKKGCNTCQNETVEWKCKYKYNMDHFRYKGGCPKHKLH